MRIEPGLVLRHNKSAFEADLADAHTEWDGRKLVTYLGAWRLEMTPEEAWKLGQLLWCELTRGAVGAPR